MRGRNEILICVSAAIGASAAELPPPAQVKVDFARDIQPILDRSCLSCHGPQRPKGGLRLENRDSALRGGDSGKAILPGDSTNSPLVLIVAGLHDEIERMPPKGKGAPLTPEDIGWLRAWIDQRAEWSEAGIVWVLQTQSRQDAADLKSATSKFHPVGGALN